MKGPQNELLTKENLERLYVNDPKASLSSVAEKIGVHKETVRRWVIRYGLPIKPRQGHGAQKPENKPMEDGDWLKLQLETKSIPQIADELGTTLHDVWYWKRKHKIDFDVEKSEAVKQGLKKRYPDGRKGKDHPMWKGGKRIAQGYVFVYAPDHPAATKARPYVQEHRLVMEKALGRYLEPDEIVHHLDGNRQNNSLDNLVIKLRGEHVSEHFEASHEVIQMRQELAKLKKENKELKEELKRYKDTSHN